MKYIEKHYQDLIEQIESAHDYVVGDLKAHINWLEKKITGEDELAEQIDEYENFKSDCAACDVVIRELREENARLKKELQGAKISAGRLKANKTKKKQSNRGRYVRKSVVCQCKDCGTYFEAKSKTAKYCSTCKSQRVKESKAKWFAKQK